MNTDELEEEIAHQQELLANYLKRLMALEKRQAILGFSADVAIEIEINDIKQKMQDCKMIIDKKERLLRGQKYELIRSLKEIIKRIEQDDTTIEDVEGIMREMLMKESLFKYIISSIFPNISKWVGETTLTKSDVIDRLSTYICYLEREVGDIPGSGG
jgi:hypothetical protein